MGLFGNEERIGVHDLPRRGCGCGLALKNNNAARWGRHSERNEKIEFVPLTCMRFWSERTDRHAAGYVIRVARLRLIALASAGCTSFTRLSSLLAPGDIRAVQHTKRALD